MAPEELLGVHGPAARDASSHIFSSERFSSESIREQAHGPAPSGAVPANHKAVSARPLPKGPARHRLAHAEARWKRVQKRDCSGSVECFVAEFRSVSKPGIWIGRTGHWLNTGGWLS